jgi:hypothetical protein
MHRALGLIPAPKKKRPKKQCMDGETVLEVLSLRLLKNL